MGGRAPQAVAGGRGAPSLLCFSSPPPAQGVAGDQRGWACRLLPAWGAGGPSGQGREGRGCPGRGSAVTQGDAGWRRWRDPHARALAGAAGGHGRARAGWGLSEV